MNEYLTSLDRPIEAVRYAGLTVKLLSTGDGTEVIHHTLQEGSRWSMQPQEGWTASESIFITSGSLKVTVDEETKVLSTGDVVSASPIKQGLVFLALEETEFIYISSQPVFQFFSEIVRKNQELAIEVALKDGYTAEHCKRIMQMSMLIGERMELSPGDMCTLNYASYLHDVGKIMIPKSILLKEGPLSEEEWEEMKRHCTYGKELLEATDSPYMRASGTIVEQHHERFDGKGYPNGLQRDEISPLAYIVSVVDAFDAMTTDRPYRKAMSVENAIEELNENAGTMFHPEVVKIFIDLIPEWSKMKQGV
ncbi:MULTISPECIES: HD domain-containing phosphohydrolase [Pontibacillus]|uniref:HD domain-containing protein n=1 Tax=Pontibacillus chungwhensis TaxID=265426 RepID=A0ABY8UTJ0_9BACI|nr:MULTISPECIES: HD domain-containing phosphohydrolase [Pontibacillus]MCD5323434.1 HD domain-containing protein [Pontibacillus sp. HN14]WIF96814.1 HD domain-containing protein [Pontibacillus chungwhensis]